MTDLSLEHHINSIIEKKVQPLVKEIAELRKLFSDKGNKEYLSAKEVSAIYGISASTLWRHCNNHLLEKHIIQGKTLYKKSELEGLITKV